MRVLFTFMLLIITANISVYAQLVDTPGNKQLRISNSDSSIYVGINAGMQHLMMGALLLDAEIEGEEAEPAFLQRRARVALVGAIPSSNIRAEFQAGFRNQEIGYVKPTTAANDLVVLDAVLKWNLFNNFELWAGQAKLPGNRERVSSSFQLQLADRSLSSQNYHLDRDIGLQAHYAFKIGNMVLKEAVALSQGEGFDSGFGNVGGYNYTGRLELQPLGAFSGTGDQYLSDLVREDRPRLAIGAAYDYNDNATRDRGQWGTYFTSEFTQRDLVTIVGDLLFKYNGLSISGEYINRSTDLVVVYTDSLSTLREGAFQTGTGIAGQIGYLLRNDIEIAGRYSQIRPDNATLQRDVSQATLGASKYFASNHFRLQTDVSITDIEDATDPFLTWRIQLQWVL